MENISNISETQNRKDKAFTKYQKMMFQLNLIVIVAGISYIIEGAMLLFNPEMRRISELCETKQNQMGSILLITSGILAAWLGVYCIVTAKKQAIENEIKIKVTLLIVLGLAIIAGTMHSHWQNECSPVLKKFANYKENLFCGVVFGGVLVLFLCLLAALILSRREITKPNQDISNPETLADSFLLEEIVVEPNPIPPPSAPEKRKSNPRHVVLRENQGKVVKQLNGAVTNHWIENEIVTSSLQTIKSIPEIIVKSILPEVIVVEIHPIPPPSATEIPTSNPRHLVLR